MEKWLQDRLSHCLDFEVPNDMIKYILTLKTSDEFDEYFASLLNPDFEEHRIFMHDCKQRLFSKQIPNKKTFNQNQQQLSSKIQNNYNNKKQGSTGNETSAVGKKKTKYTNLFNTDHTIMLKGRRSCDCFATEHKLINNCLSCGRVVCEQEGSGPCMFCGELVCTNEEMQVIKASGKKGENLKKALQEKNGGGEGLRKALEQRDKLLEYDRDGEKRTEVIDDEEDYFYENSVWLSDVDREKFNRLKQEMHEKRHANRSSRKVKMDLFGREIEEDPVPQEYEAKVRKEIADTIAKSNTDTWSNRKHNQSSDSMGISDPRNDGPKPSYVPIGKQNSSTHGLDNEEIPYNRVQDKELMEMQDMRRCLSMHQPYASLLVHGIKKHEGRTWYSSHRGRLWIASTAKEPTLDEIKEVEDFYKHHYKDKDIKFPSQYQSGSLLGCVLVDDVLPQEEYRKKFPDGESESPFVFICKNPKVLPVVFPNSGSHKIYQIDPKVHRAACMALLRGNNSKSGE